LLQKVLDSLSNACIHATRRIELNITLDLVNNKPDEANKDLLSSFANSSSLNNMSVTFIDAGFNGGYGAGNNISISRHKDADFHLVLNPDVLIQEDAITNAVVYLVENPDVGLLTPQVKGLDGRTHYLCKRNPTLFDMFVRSTSSPFINRLFLKRNYKYEMRDYDYQNIIKPVPYPTGCFMFFRSDVLVRIGGFDEGYFLHYEDADIGRSLSQISQTAYVPSVVVLHKWSRDTHKSWYMRLITIKSGLRYWRKWGGVF
jgi:GT2 family glycosyltransferase